MSEAMSSSRAIPAHPGRAARARAYASLSSGDVAALADHWRHISSRGLHAVNGGAARYVMKG